ncbi:MAG: hypothetical protein OXN84_02555 [Albidovulum sp.]|nr:hypothetical protein [Albidovulum sp.]
MIPKSDPPAVCDGLNIAVARIESANASEAPQFPSLNAMPVEIEISEFAMPAPTQSQFSALRHCRNSLMAGPETVVNRNAAGAE